MALPAQKHPVNTSSKTKPSSKKSKSDKTVTKPLDRDIKDYMELVETVARVEYSRLPNHLIDYSEIVNIGALALHVMFTNNPTREYNITYMSTAIKWAVRNELRNRYKWYAQKTTEVVEDEENGFDDDLEPTKSSVREAVYSTILSVDSMMEAENPHEIRDESATPDEESEVSETAKLVRACIAELPERDQQVLEARFFKHLRMREIGAQLGISPSRTSRVVQSAMDKLKVRLQRKGITL